MFPCYHGALVHMLLCGCFRLTQCSGSRSDGTPGEEGAAYAPSRGENRASHGLYGRIHSAEGPRGHGRRCAQAPAERLGDGLGRNHRLDLERQGGDERGVREPQPCLRLCRSITGHRVLRAWTLTVTVLIKWNTKKYQTPKLLNFLRIINFNQ